MTATRVGDIRQFFATSSSSSRSLVDNLRLVTIPSSSLKGANFWIASPVDSLNFWVESRVKESSEETQTLTLATSLATDVSVGDIAWLTNIHSKGFWRADYIDALNTIIQTAYPKYLEPLTYTFDGAWLMETRRVTI